uniref:Cchamide 2 n=1 Tax=Nilaparvata lugens TaxID=108931 RepID=U3U9X8_NILLU|nr:cchamide 2 [Nilaparvata lugens]
MTSMRLAPAITCIYLLLVAAALADMASARKRGLEDVRQELIRIYGAQGSPKRILRPRKGCASFGHSCFGGHGKRAVEEILPPRDYDMPMPSSDNAMDEQRLANNEIEPDIVPILRQWLLSYRNRQLGSGLK